MKGKDFLGGMLVGAIVGAAVGLLLAPQSGEEMREMIGEQARGLGGKVKEGSKQMVDGGRDLFEQGKAQLSDVMKRAQRGAQSAAEPGSEA